jgi:hypothetical protein
VAHTCRPAEPVSSSGQVGLQDGGVRKVGRARKPPYQGLWPGLVLGWLGAGALPTRCWDVGVTTPIIGQTHPLSGWAQEQRRRLIAGGGPGIPGPWY